MTIKLICLDMDGVLVPAANFWLELHHAFGTLEEGTVLTKAYLTTDYQRLVTEVGRLWAGKDAKPYYDLVASIHYLPGIKELFTALDRFIGPTDGRVPRAIISGGSYAVADRIAKEFGVNFIFANELVIKEGRASGDFHLPVGAGGYTKRQIIEQLCDDLEILPGEVLMIGDSDSDMDAFLIVGTSIAFNCASKQLKSAATYVVDSSDLRDVLPVLERIKSES